MCPSSPHLTPHPVHKHRYPAHTLTAACVIVHCWLAGRLAASQQQTPPPHPPPTLHPAAPFQRCGPVFLPRVTPLNPPTHSHRAAKALEGALAEIKMDQFPRCPTRAVCGAYISLQVRMCVFEGVYGMVP